jgi:hypothetical protein
MIDLQNVDGSLNLFSQIASNVCNSEYGLIENAIISKLENLHANNNFHKKVSMQVNIQIIR